MRHSMSLVAGVAVLLLGVSTLATHAQSQNAKVPTVAELVGSYKYTGDRAKEEADIKSQTDKAMSDMGKFVLKRAVPRLKAATRVPENINISKKGSDITFKMDDHVVTVPEDGGTVNAKTPIGEDAKASYDVKTATLRLQTSGNKTNKFRFNASGQLLMEVNITNSRLTQPVSFTSTYARSK